MIYKIVGKSKQIKAIVESIQEIASSNAVVLITGEKGTGKELVARHVHYYSKNHNKRFVALHGASISNRVLESAIRECDGTMYLSEITELELTLQVNLLRMLKEKEFELSKGISKDNCRFISSTSHDIYGEMKSGNLREDLFHLLNVVHLAIPPLRLRRDDIPLLVEDFLSTFCQREKKTVNVSDEAFKILMNYTWRGNVRELKNVIERAVILVKDTIITPKELPIYIFSSTSSPSGKMIEEVATDGSLEDVAKKAMTVAERQHIIEVLRSTGGNKSKAAKKLRVCYKTLFNKIKEYDIETI